MNVLKLISVGAIWSKAWPILIAIIFFGFLIFFHELGHFTFAKIFKVKVNEFSMGMGPALFKFKKGETRYALRLFPIGGFVSMEGEDKDSEDERAFNNRPAWQRFIVVAAGGTINLIMGIIIVGIMLGSSGDLIGTTRIHSFAEGAASSKFLQAGDEIVKIDGKRVFSEYDINYLMTRTSDGVFDFTVKRNGEKVVLNDVRFDTVVKEIEGHEMTTIIYDFIIVGVDPSIKTLPGNTLRVSASMARMVYLSLFDLVTGQYGLSDLSGPIGTVSYIADAAQTAAEETDYSYLYTLVALIAINVGLFNLLPLPALDGGRLFFILIEMIFRKPVPRKYEGWVHAIGMILLLALMAVVSFSDILKLVRGQI